MRHRAARAADACLVAFLLLALMLAIVTRLVEAGGGMLIEVVGSSMEPAIPRGALLVAEPVRPADLEVGDVVTVRARPDVAIVTHRIARIVDRPDGRWLELRGDANADPDPVLVPASVVMGRVAHVVPWMGRGLAVARSSGGLLTIAGVVGLLVAASLAWSTRTPSVPRRERARHGARSISGPSLSRPG